MSIFCLWQFSKKPAKLVRLKSLFLILLSVWGLGLASVRAETQSTAQTDNAFDRQVLDTILGRGLNDFWDVSGSANKFNPGMPVAIHFSEWGAPVELGDAVQQRNIGEPFELGVGFYEKLPNSSEATVVAVHDIKIDQALWQKLWGKITPAELKALEDVFKTGPDKNAMFFAKGEAARIKMKGAVIQIDPQIKRNQRQVVCYIPFEIFHAQLLNDPVPKKQQGLTLWGQPFKSKLDLGPVKPQETVVATIDRNGKPVSPKNSTNTAAAKKPEPQIETKTTKVVLDDRNRVGPASVPNEPKKPSQAEINAAILAAQEGKVTPATPGVVTDKPSDPLPTVDTGWQRIETDPIKVK